MSAGYKSILCPECQHRTILMELEGSIEGKIRVHCRRCKEYFIVTGEGKITNERIKEYDLILCPECGYQLTLLDTGKKSGRKEDMRIMCRHCYQSFIASADGTIINAREVE